MSFVFLYFVSSADVLLVLERVLPQGCSKLGVDNYRKLPKLPKGKNYRKFAENYLKFTENSVIITVVFRLC